MEEPEKRRVKVKWRFTMARLPRSLRQLRTRSLDGTATSFKNLFVKTYSGGFVLKKFVFIHTVISTTEQSFMIAVTQSWAGTDISQIANPHDGD